MTRWILTNVYFYFLLGVSTSILAMEKFDQNLVNEFGVPMTLPMTVFHRQYWLYSLFKRAKDGQRKFDLDMMNKHDEKSMFLEFYNIRSMQQVSIEVLDLVIVSKWLFFMSFISLCFPSFLWTFSSLWSSLHFKIKDKKNWLKQKLTKIK